MSYLDEYKEQKEKENLVVSIYYKAYSKDFTNFNNWLGASPLNSSVEALEDVLNVMNMSKTKFRTYLRKVIKSVDLENIKTRDEYNFIVCFLDRCLVARVLMNDLENAYYLRKHLYNLAINNFDFETSPGLSYN